MYKIYNNNNNNNNNLIYLHFSNEEIEYIKYFNYFYPLENESNIEKSKERYYFNKISSWCIYSNNKNNFYNYIEWEKKIYIPRLMEQLEKMKIKKEINFINICLLLANKYIDQRNV